MSNTLIDLTSQEDFDLNDLPERVSFAPWPKGIYECTVDEFAEETQEYADGNLVPGYIFKVTLNRVVSVAPDTGLEDLPSEEANQSWFFPKVGKDDKGTKRCLGEIRNLLMPFGKALGSTKFSEVSPWVKNQPVTLVTDLYIKTRDDGTTRGYSNIVTVYVGHFQGD